MVLIPDSSAAGGARARSGRSVRRAAAALLIAGSTLFACGAATASADSAAGLYIRGGGYGHGIGMSQYGALGYAQHGWSYRQILEHYYHGITLAQASTSRIVTVLLKTGSAAFSGASTAGGKTLKPSLTYTVQQTKTGSLQLTAPGLKKPVGPFDAPLTVTGNGPLDLAGLGLYRGSLVFRPSGSGIESVNSVGLEDYVRGVVAAEMPSGWPAAALQAQAVAARTYVLTSGAASGDYDVYSDTRSQMYRGVAAETAATDAAIAATSGQIATYAGAPAVTYFFSSSGGYTEDVQNVWQGVTPEAWLQGEPDPYDGAGSNPYHRWLVHLSLRSAAADLRGLVRGTLVGITVTRHGVSPRVVTASVVGTKGRTTVTGTQLQEAFGLMSTYMSFTTIRVQSTSGKTSRKSGGKTGGKSGGTGSSGGSGPFSPTVQAPGQSSSGGASFQGGSQRKVSGGSQTPLHGREVHGTVFPARRGTRIAVQQLETSGYVTVARGRTHSGGWYAIRVPMPGTFRVVVGGVAGPSVAVR